MPPPAASSGLYAQYSSPAGRVGSPSRAKSQRSTHNTTRSAQLRAAGVRLACYLNSEVDSGRSTIVQLPAECDTLAEVIPKIQQRMQLEKKMLYACELFLPSGEIIKSFKTLQEAAAADSPIIVGCGEPFDPLRIPNGMLEFHLNGGGRKAVKSVHKELQDKRKQERAVRAQTVREAGHGFTNEATVVARTQHVEANREQYRLARQRYMQGLAYTAQQQEELLQSVYQNVAYSRMEQEESRETREYNERERRERLRLERQQQEDDLRMAREAEMDRVQSLHDKVKAGPAGEHQGGWGWKW